MTSMNPRLEHREVNALLRIGALVHGRADVIHLEFGEPDFPTPAHIVAAAQVSLANERQTYGPGPGLPSLRAAIAERVARVNRFAPQPEQVVATTQALRVQNGSYRAVLQVSEIAGKRYIDKGWREE